MNSMTRKCSIDCHTSKNQEFKDFTLGFSVGKIFSQDSDITDNKILQETYPHLAIQ